MFKAQVFTAAGESAGEQDLPESLFDGTIHQPAMWQAVKAYLANQRQATAATKTRSEVSGGNKKPWRQKGTGRARQGSIRAAQWRGGGRVFGPRPGRNYKQELPRQLRWLARRSAYNVRAEDSSVILIERIELDAPKTRRMVDLLEKTGVSGNVLVLTDGHSPLVHLSARNVRSLQVRPFGEESTYDLLWADTLLIEKPALERAAEVAHA